MKDLRNLKVWTKSQELTLTIYKVISKFPKEELYRLTSQMRRLSASIAQNIAKGCGRGSDVEFSRFLQITFGSASELNYHIILAKDLLIINEVEYDDLIRKLKEIMQMLSSLIKKIRIDCNEKRK